MNTTQVPVLRIKAVDKVLEVLKPFETLEAHAVTRYFLAMHGSEFPEQMMKWLVDSSLNLSWRARKELAAVARRCAHAAQP